MVDDKSATASEKTRLSKAKWLCDLLEVWYKGPKYPPSQRDLIRGHNTLE